MNLLHIKMLQVKIIMINNRYHAYGVLNICLKLTTNPRKTSTFQLWLNHHASCEFSTMRLWT
jgi:hypothetical protein